MAEIGQSWRWLDVGGTRAMDEAIIRRTLLQDEGHASTIERKRDPVTDERYVVIMVAAGRPKGWFEVYGDEDDDLTAEERAHFGLGEAGE